MEEEIIINEEILEKDVDTFNQFNNLSTSEITYNEQLLEQININSYNLNEEFKKLNQELLTDTTTESAITINQAIKKIDTSINLLTAVIIIYVVFSVIKLRGERNGY